jgi:hypothetical protein
VAGNPLVLLRNGVLGLTGVVILVCLADWSLTMRALPSVRIAVSLHPSAIPADGKSRSQIVVRVTEGGKPRANDYLEAVSLDSGYLVPLLALTNQQGEARFTYASLPASPYDTATSARILFTDTSLGRIIEVDKSTTVSVHLLQPKSG